MDPYFKSLCDNDKEKNSLSYNIIARKLFNLKLNKYLENQDLDIDKINIDLVCKYADYTLLLKAYNKFKDDNLVPTIIQKIPYELYFPDDRWSPENFLIKSVDGVEIEMETLTLLEERNNAETIWLKQQLIPSLHHKSTFKINKPMVFYNSDKDKDKDKDRNKNKNKNNNKNKTKIRRVLIPVINKISAKDIEKVVKLRMIENVLVRLCLIHCGTTDNEINLQFVEWLSTKLNIPLIKYDLSIIYPHVIKDSDLKQFVREKDFSNNEIWLHGLQTYIDNIKFNNIEFIYDNANKDIDADIEFLNSRNIPFLSV